MPFAFADSWGIVTVELGKGSFLFDGFWNYRQNILRRDNVAINVQFAANVNYCNSKCYILK